MTDAQIPGFDPATRWLLRQASVEVLPRTLAKVDNLRALLPVPREVFIAHIEGTPISEMIATARRLRAEGFEPVPHVPARLVPDAATLRDWLARYRGEADIRAALVLAGSPATPCGAYEDSLALLASSHFEGIGLDALYVAGHPEGNRAAGADGAEAALMQAARWKQQFAARSGLPVTMVTQFVFDTRPVLDWTARLAAEGINLPVRVGLAGPARLQTLLRYGITCGVGASLGVLQRRAKDVTKLLKPHDPADLLRSLARNGAGDSANRLSGVHFFPLGGIPATAEMIARGSVASGRPAA